MSLYFERPIYAGPTFGPDVPAEVPADVAKRDTAHRDRREAPGKARAPRVIAKHGAVTVYQAGSHRVTVFAPGGARKSQTIKVRRDSCSGSLAGKGNPTGRDARYAVAARRAVAAMHKGA